MHIVMKIFSEKEFFLFVPSSTYGRIGEKYLICKKIVSIISIDKALQGPIHECTLKNFVDELDINVFNF